jgi:type III secretion protein S
MTGSSILSHLSQAVSVYLVLVLPALLVALCVGLLVGIMQAATQIQDQTLPQTAKLLAVIGSMVLLAPLLVVPLLDHATRLFSEFPGLTR